MTQRRLAIFLTLASAAMILARILGVLADDALFELSPPPVPLVVSTPAAAVPRFAAFLERNLFRAARGPRPQPQPSCTATSPGPRLIATVVGDGEAVAAIDGDPIALVHEGDRLPTGARVLSIHAREVLLDTDGSCGRLQLEDTPATPAPDPRVAVLKSAIRRLSDHEFELSRREIEPHLSNPNYLLGEGRIVPSFDSEHHPDGFRIFSVRPGGLFAAIGLENGDVVQRIDGYEVTDGGRMLDFYVKLREGGEQTLTLDLRRRGAPETLTFHLR